MSKRRFGVVTSDAQKEFESKQKRVYSGYSTVSLPDGFSFLRLPKDKNFIRVDVIPFLSETENGQVPLTRCNYFIHRNIGADASSVICPQNQKGLRCPVCEFVRGLSWSDPTDQELWRKYKEQKRQLYAMFWLDAPDEFKDKIMVFDTSEYGFGRMLDEKIQKRDISDPQEKHWDRYADLLEGVSMKLNIGELSAGGQRTYTGVTSIEFKERTKQYSEDLYDQVPDLMQCLNILDYDVIKERFTGKPIVPFDQAQEAEEDVSSSSSYSSFDPTSGFNPIVRSTPPEPRPYVDVIDDSDTVF